MGSSAPPTPLTTTPAGRPSYRRALGQRSFLLVFVAQLVSQSGDFVFDVALLWLVLRTTGSVFAVGVVVTAALVPAVVLGPFLGVYVDRWPRRVILIVTNLLEGALIAVLSGLVLAHATGLGLVVAIVAALGAGSQVVRIASSALVPQTVDPADLPAANGLLTFSGAFNQIVGLSVGGVVVALVGVSLPIEYDALSFLAAAALVAAIPPAVGRPVPGEQPGRPRFRTQFVEGLAFVRGQRFLVEVIGIGIVVNFFANAVAALWAPYAALTLNGNAATYGFLGAAVAAGSVIGALVAGKIDARRFAGRSLFGGAMGIGAAIVALGLTRSIAPAFVEAFALGTMLSITNVPLLTVVQAKVPARLLGRVTAVLFSVIVVAGPVGAIFAGSLAQATTLSTVFLLSGLFVLAIMAVGSVALKDLRNVAY
ncbi:MAG: MFS transporter [Thermoplasmata archaeon]